VHVVQRFATETGLAVHADEELVREGLQRRVEELSKEAPVRTCASRRG
jgi:hypothetical protein